MIELYNVVLVQPLFNLLIIIYNLLPGQDFGWAIVVLTVAVRLVLSPLSVKALLSQRHIAKIQPKLQELQKKYKNDRQALTQATMAMYKEYGVNPLSGCLPILIQIPLLLALYSVFSRGFEVKSLEMLYSFVQNPGPVNQIAFGLFDLASKNPVMAVLAGGFQFIQSKLSINNQPSISTTSGDPSMANMMNKQMLYFLPVFITIIAWNLPFGITLYWVVTTVFSIFEQIYINKRYSHI